MILRSQQALLALLFCSLLCYSVTSPIVLSYAISFDWPPLVDNSLLGPAPVTTSAATSNDIIDSNDDPRLYPAMRDYRQRFRRAVEYDNDEPDSWGDGSWVYSEFDLLFDVFAENRVQTYLQLLSEATGFDVARIVPLRNTVGNRGLAYGHQTLFSIKLLDALPRQDAVTWPPGYVPPTTIMTSAPSTSVRPTTAMATTTVPTTTEQITTTMATTTLDGNETTDDSTSAMATTTDAPTTLPPTTTKLTTTAPPTTTARVTRVTTPTTRPPRTLAPRTTEAPQTTTQSTGGGGGGGGGGSGGGGNVVTTAFPGETPVPESPRPFRNSDAAIFVNAVRRQLGNHRSPLSRARLVSIRRVYPQKRTVETIFVGVDYMWVAFIVFAVLVVFLSVFLVLRNRPQQEQDVAEYSPSEGVQQREAKALNTNDEAQLKRERKHRMAAIHKSKIEYAKQEGVPMPLTRGRLKRAQLSRFLKEKASKAQSDPMSNEFLENDIEREQDAIRAAYHDPHFTSVAAAFQAMDEETGEYTKTGTRLSKTEASEALAREKAEMEERKRTERLPLVQMLMHDHQFALPYSPLENAERKARWIRELRQNDAIKGRAQVIQNRKRKAAEAAAAAAAAALEEAKAKREMLGFDSEDASFEEENASFSGASADFSGEDDHPLAVFDDADLDDPALGLDEEEKKLILARRQRKLRELEKRREKERKREAREQRRREHLEMLAEQQGVSADGVVLDQTAIEMYMDEDEDEEFLNELNKFDNLDDEFELEAKKIREAAAAEEAARENALDVAIAAKIAAAKGKRNSMQELMDADPMKIGLWKEALQPGKYEYRVRNKLELFDQTKVHRAFEEDIRKGGWKRPIGHRMIQVGLGDYDENGNFTFKDHATDDPLLLNPRTQEEAEAEKMKTAADSLGAAPPNAAAQLAASRQQSSSMLLATPSNPLNHTHSSSSSSSIPVPPSVSLPANATRVTSPLDGIGPPPPMMAETIDDSLGDRMVQQRRSSAVAERRASYANRRRAAAPQFNDEWNEMTEEMTTANDFNRPQANTQSNVNGRRGGDDSSPGGHSSGFPSGYDEERHVDFGGKEIYVSEGSDEDEEHSDDALLGRGNGYRPPTKPAVGRSVNNDDFEL